jgi:peroxiredoxin/uncharacterized membrane protein YphA (DoxX/SURF4 family)
MESALFIARLILAVLLVVAAAAKLVDRDRFLKSLRDFGVTRRWLNALAGIVPLSELIAAALLLLPQTSVPGALFTFVLLLAFTTTISYNLVLGREPECNCFGQIGSSTISVRTLFRNALLALVAAAIVVESPSTVPSDQRLLLLIVLTLAATATTLFALVYEVARRQEDLARRFDGIQDSVEGGSFSESAAGAPKSPAQELAVGAPAPSFQLFTLDGSEVTLIDVLSSGRSAVVFFMSAECAPCFSLLPEISLWRHELGKRFNFIVVSKGGIDSNRAKFGNGRLDSSIPILADHDGTVARDYRVKGTPGAVFIAADGVIASQLASGNKEIRSLLNHLIFSPETKPWSA